jgi:hypothetical protein
MKRYIVLILAVVMVVTVGCKADGESRRETPEPLTTSATSGKDSEIVTSDSTLEKAAEADTITYERSWMAQDSAYWYTAGGSEEGRSCIYAISKGDESERLVYQTEKKSYRISNMALDTAEGSIYFLIVEREDEESEFIFSPFQICTIKKDGTNFSVLLTRDSMPVSNDEIITDLAAYDGCLLLKSNFRTLFLYNLHTAETKVVDDTVTVFGFHGDKLYYISNWSLVVTDIELKEKQVLLQATVEWDKRESKNLVGRVLFVGDDLFYCQRAPYGIYQYLDGERKLIYDGLGIDGEMAVFSHAGKLYFMREEGETDTLIQYDPQTESMTEMLTLSQYKYVYKVIDGYLYFSDLHGKIQKKKIELPM